MEVNPNRVDQLAQDLKRLVQMIENQEVGMNKEVQTLLHATNAKYSEMSVRVTVMDLERQLWEIRKLAQSITEKLEDKSKVLTQAAARYRSDETMIHNMTQPSVGWGTVMARLNQYGRNLGKYFIQPIIQALPKPVKPVLHTVIGKALNLWTGPRFRLPVHVKPLQSNLVFNPNEYSEEVKQLQGRLTQFGYEVEVSGYFDDLTLTAVNAFKEATGQNHTGNASGCGG